MTFSSGGNIDLGGRTSLTILDKETVTFQKTDLGGTFILTAVGTNRNTYMTQILDFPPLQASTTQDLMVSVAGATVGDTVTAVPMSALEPGLMSSAFIASPGLVTIRLANITSNVIDPAPVSWKVVVVRN